MPRRVIPPIDPDEAAVFWRWIGVLEDGSRTCPEPPWQLRSSGWRTRSLFSSAAIGRCSGLERFCVWEYGGGSSQSVPPADKICLDELDGDYEHTTQGMQDPMPCRDLVLVDVEPDLMALAPLGGMLSSIAWQVLEQHFLEQAGKIALPTYTTSPPEVRLTLIDTSPTTGNNPLNDPENSPHGEALGHFARFLLCDPPTGGSGSSCVADIRTRLALAYVSIDQNDPTLSKRSEEQGGYFGLIGELAEALMEELDDSINLGVNRLVLNLSVAWDPLYGGATPVADMPPSVQAVYRAIECAACQPGVVVVAAAGNLADLHAANDPAQPMMPAAWTELAISTSDTCDRRTPLLYAVGGLDSRRQALSNALGIPEFVAYGDHTVVGSGLSAPTATLTGSSSSTLVVSATAAAAAYYAYDAAPNISAEEIMSRIYWAGEQNAQTADFCRSSLEGICPKASYVSLCESVHAVCKLNCPVTLPPCTARSNNLPDFSSSSLQGFTTSIVDVNALYPFSPGCPICFDDLPLLALTSPVADPCPRRQYHGLSRQPFTHSQPASNPCPTCFFDVNTGTFYAEIETAPGEQLQNPTLHLVCSGSLENYRAPFAPLHDTNRTFEIKGLPMSPPSDCTSAMFAYTVHTVGNNDFLGANTVPILIGTGPPPPPP